MNFLKTTVALFTLVTVANLGAVEKAPPIDFLSPQGGELYIIGQTQKIVIKTTFKTLALEISRDGGVTFVALGTANLVSAKLGAQFVWTVNAPASTNAMLRATGNKRGKVSVVKSQAFVIDTVGVGRRAIAGHHRHRFDRGWRGDQCEARRTEREFKQNQQRAGGREFSAGG